MLSLGTVRPGRIITIPFETFAGSTGAPITLTGLAVGDVKCYKDGSTTERASTSGYVLLDTDGIDFDAITGIHGFSIDLSDNTTADFWACGSTYFVVVSTITVDSQTMSFLAAHFKIGYDSAVLNTTLATLATQTSFTLTIGPADDDALNGAVVILHDAASAVQQSFAVVSDYTGATKTVTLVAAPIFTIAAKDNISFFPPALGATVPGRTLDVSATGESGLDWANVGNPTTTVVLSGTTIKTSTDVEADTQDIQARLPAALVAGRVDASIGALNGSATAAQNLERSASSIYRGSITATSTSTALIDSGLTQSGTDHWKGRIVIFTSGTLAGQATDILAFTPVSDTLTVTALTAAPATSDQFVIV